jgi:hypothetical protein
LFRVLRNLISPHAVRLVEILEGGVGDLDRTLRVHLKLLSPNDSFQPHHIVYHPAAKYDAFGDDNLFTDRDVFCADA